MLLMRHKLPLPQTYSHVAMALLAFIAVEAILLNVVPGKPYHLYGKWQMGYGY